MNEPQTNSNPTSFSLPERIVQILYNFFILPLLVVFVHFAALVHPKIRRGLSGRRHLLARLQKALNTFDRSRPVLLLHAASMGEYEQARPVMRELRRQAPEWLIVASVFSPSVYEHICAGEEADVVTYLPLDFPAAVGRFLEAIRPRALMIVRHDIWPNLLWQAASRNIRTLLIDASVHEGSLRHRWGIRQFYRLLFRRFDVISAVSAAALEGMAAFLSPPVKAIVHGDTRFDQVIYRAREKRARDLLPEEVLHWRPIWVAGSTWPEDEAVILPAFTELCRKFGLKLILVPHEPTEAHIQESIQKCARLGLRVQRLSTFNNRAEADVLLVDRIGILAGLYGAGRFAFVGGSFGPGVHSVIEAAAHGLPVLFGPRMRNSLEAIAMVEEGCGFVIHDSQSCLELVKHWLQEEAVLDAAARRARAFVDERTGASEKIVRTLLECVSDGDDSR